METKKLYRLSDNKVIAGVCGGFGLYFDIDPTLVRLIFIIITIWGGVGFVLYIVCWILLPTKTITEAKKVKSDKEDETANNHEALPKGRKTAELLGLFIVLLGVLILFKNLFSIFDFLNFNYFWPIILIIIGISLIATSEKNKGEK